MNAILNLFLLLGLFPGAVLPSGLTDRLLAPAPQPNEDPSDPAQPAPDGSNDSQESPPSLSVPSTYSAIRPPLELTRGELRTISTRQACWLGARNYNAHAPSPIDLKAWSVCRIMAPDHCHVREPGFLSPPKLAHAPPLNS